MPCWRLGLRRSGARRRLALPEPTQDRGAALASLGGSGLVASTLSPRPGAVGPASRRRRRYADASAAALLNRSCGRRARGGVRGPKRTPCARQLLRRLDAGSGARTGSTSAACSNPPFTCRAPRSR